MSERLLSSTLIDLISAGKVEPEIFLLADFPSGTRRFWTGKGTYTDSEASWEGIGGLIEIDSIQESIDSAAHGIRVKINGLDTVLVQSILGEEYQGHAAEIWLGFWDRESNRVIFTDEPAWKGTLDTDESEIMGDKTDLTILCEHRMVDILRKREIRYTHQDQQNLYPSGGDTGLSYMESIQDVTIPWGRTQL